MKTFLARQGVRLALISLALALFLVYIFLIPHQPGSYRAVPSQTSILIEFNGLISAGKQLQQVQESKWKSVLKTAVLQNCWKEIAQAETIFHHNTDARSAFATNKLLAAFSLHPADSLHALFILDAGAALNLKKILEHNAAERPFFPYQFQSQTLYTVHLDKNERVVLACKGRLLLFSRYSYLVEDALKQLETTRGWWADNQYLGNLSPEAPLRIFFRPSKWQAQHAGNLINEARVIPDMLSANIAWMGIAFNGQKLSSMAEADGFLAGLGAWNGSKHGDIFSVMPDNTALLALAGFNNRNLFYKQLAAESSGDFDQFVLPWIDKEAALVVTEPLSPAMTDDRLLVFAVSDSALAQESLEAYGQRRGQLAHEKIGMFDVYGFQNPSLLRPFFSGQDPAFQNPYFVHLGDYVVVAPNRPAIEVYIEKYIANQTLSQNTDFLQLQQRLKPEGRALIALNGAYFPGIMAQLFQQNEAPRNWAADVQRFSATGWLAAEITPEIGRKLDLKWLSQPQQTQLPESNMFWKTSLAAPALVGVFEIAQPGMEMGSALLVQDKQTQLYCLQPDGAISWQKQLGSFMMSPLKDVDYYQNGRKCYLFNTKSQVWILDENGKDVQGYPLTMKAPASTVVSVVDFDKNLKFNYFVCCENGSVYGFDLYGRALDGWNPQANVGNAAGPVLHFQHNGKDYLAVLNKAGLLSVFGRDGKPRFPALTLNGTFSNAPLLDKSGAKPRIICISREGRIYACDLTGKLQELTWPGKVSGPVHKTLALNGAGASFAVLQGKQLTALKLTGNTLQKVFSRAFPDLQDDLFPVGEGIGLCARGRRKITLLDKTGKIVKGFPLAGSTPFSLCRIGQQELIVSGNGSAVYAYKVAATEGLSDPLH